MYRRSINPQTDKAHNGLYTMADGVTNRRRRTAMMSRQEEMMTAVAPLVQLLSSLRLGIVSTTWDKTMDYIATEGPKIIEYLGMLRGALRNYESCWT